MPTNYSPFAKQYMLLGLAASIDSADPLPGYIEIYDGDVPTIPGDPIVDQVLLATVFFGLPCGEIVTDVLSIFGPIEDSNVVASGVVAWGRVFSGADNWVADFDIGLAESGASMEVNTVTLQIYKGGIFRVNTALFTLP